MSVQYIFSIAVFFFLRWLLCIYHTVYYIHIILYIYHVMIYIYR